MDELITFQRYPTEDAAIIIANKLEQEGIETEIVKKVRRIDANLIGDNHDDEYEIKIAPAAFNRANKLLYNEAAVSLNDIDADHPLLMLSIDELKDVAGKPYEWGADNYNIALALLKSKGIDIPAGKLAQLQEEHIKVLSEKKSISPFLLILGYVSALVPFLHNYVSYQTVHNDSFPVNFRWYFPGFIGLVIGWSVLAAKTTLPDGKRITPYTTATIKHALIVLALSIFSWLLNIAIMVMMMV